jgi:hypothetical protein
MGAEFRNQIDAQLIHISDRLSPYSSTPISSLYFADDLSLLKGRLNGIKKKFTIS